MVIGIDMKRTNLSKRFDVLEGILSFRCITIRCDHLVWRKAEDVFIAFGMIGHKHAESIQQFTLGDVVSFFLYRHVKSSDKPSFTVFIRSLNLDFL